MTAAVTDLNGLQQIAVLGRKDRGAALEQVARQFESFFVSEVLKGMRAANEVFGADNPLNTQEMGFRQDMLDRQLSVSLTEGRGLGLATVFARQLRQQFDAPRTRADGQLGALDEGELAGRTVERAPATPAPASAMNARNGSAAGESLANARAIPAPEYPTVVSSALRVLRPVVEEAGHRVSEALARFVDKESFVKALSPLAREAATRLGVDHRVLLAQAALETGWGQSILGDSAGRSSHNLFNIKAGSFWPGASVGVTTLEFSGGVPHPQRARFRAYASFDESFADYVETLLSSDRYRGAVAAAADPATFLHSLARAGYATDPQYAGKILRLLRDPAIEGAP